MDADRFSALWQSLAPIGRAADGAGYLRCSYSATDSQFREWFAEEALDRELTTETDRNGNLWAWWGDPESGGAVVTGSHFDSVPHGGAYDGPLGIVSALLAVDLLRERGEQPRHPLGIAAFAEEEGSRFGLACLGSRLLTGAVAPEQALARTDRDGVSLADALAAMELDPAAVGSDPVRLSRLSAFVELHIEQGRALTAPVGVASAIWPHGRWRLDLTGEPNHAGTTADERPARPDARDRPGDPGREQAGAYGRSPRHGRPGQLRAQRYQRHRRPGQRLAGRTGARPVHCGQAN